jgi:hypothetical protein
LVANFFLLFLSICVGCSQPFGGTILHIPKEHALDFTLSNLIYKYEKKKRSEYYVCYAFAATYKGWGGGLSAPK